MLRPCTRRVGSDRAKEGCACGHVWTHYERVHAPWGDQQQCLCLPPHRAAHGQCPCLHPRFRSAARRAGQRAGRPMPVASSAITGLTTPMPGPHSHVLCDPAVRFSCKRRSPRPAPSPPHRAVVIIPPLRSLPGRQHYYNSRHCHRVCSCPLRVSLLLPTYIDGHVRTVPVLICPCQRRVLTFGGRWR